MDLHKTQPMDVEAQVKEASPRAGSGGSILRSSSLDRLKTTSAKPRIVAIEEPRIVLTRLPGSSRPDEGTSLGIEGTDKKSSPKSDVVVDVPQVADNKSILGLSQQDVKMLKKPRPVGRPRGEGYKAQYRPSASALSGSAPSSWPRGPGTVGWQSASAGDEDRQSSCSLSSAVSLSVLDLNLPTQMLLNKIFEFANGAEAIRAKSPRIQGKLSGRLKSYLEKTRILTETISSRLGSNQGEDDLRRANSRHVKEIKAFKEQLKTLQEDNAQLRMEFKRDREYYAKTYGPSILARRIFSPPKSPKKAGDGGSPVRTYSQVVAQEVPPSISSNAVGENDELVVRVTEAVLRFLVSLGVVNPGALGAVAVDGPLVGIPRGVPAPGRVGGTASKQVMDPPVKNRVELVRSMGRRVGRSTSETSRSIPPTLTDTDTEWQVVVPSKKKKKKNKKVDPGVPVSSLQVGGGGNVSFERKQAKNARLDSISKRAQAGTGRSGIPAGEKRRPPRSSAITIDVPEKDKSGEIFLNIRNVLNLGSLGIEKTRTRYNQRGALVVEVQGENNRHKADMLADKMREVVASDVRISRTIKMADLRLTGLDASIIKKEVQEAIALVGDCRADQVAPSMPRRLSNGLNVMWVKCPLSAALRAARLGSIRVGWSSIKVDLMKEKPSQCFRCLEFGHMNFACRNPVVRSGLCYNCGEAGHLRAACKNLTRCILCYEAGLQSNHRMGSAGCHALHNKGVTRAPVRRMDQSTKDFQSMETSAL